MVHHPPEINDLTTVTIVLLKKFVRIYVLNNEIIRFIAGRKRRKSALSFFSNC